MNNMNESEPSTSDTFSDPAWKPFFNGQAVKAELLMVMLEKHGIQSCAVWENGEAVDEDSFAFEPMDRIANVLVPAADYDHAWNLFYAERQDEL